MKSRLDRYAVIGHPIAHSRSPALHALFARQAGERLIYEKIDAAPGHFCETVRAFIAEGGKGLNVTLPFKGEAFALIDEATRRATDAHSVNTVLVTRAGSLTGDNTDGAGLIRDLTANHGITLRKQRILILGAGGATRGILGPLLREAPVELHIANRTTRRAHALARHWRNCGAIESSGYSELDGHRFDLVINATSASLGNQLPPLPDGLIAPGGTCYDLAYADKPTVFLQWGHAQSAAQLLDGWGMLVEQAAESFYLWRGIRPQTATILAARKRCM